MIPNRSKLMRSLRLPPAGIGGADPAKLHRQIARFGKQLDGMPPVTVYRTSDGELMVYNGVTRATRAAKLAPGRLIRVEVIGKLKSSAKNYPTVGDRLP
jgi:hypothetical protein